MLYHIGEANGKYSGVGFMINKEIADKVELVEGSSSRIARLVLKLNERYKIQIVQAYAPTSTYSDEDVETFYEELKEMYEKGADCHFKLVMGDFNAKIGKHKDGDAVVGKFGVGERNDRGQRLIQFSEETRLKIMNTFFKKQTQRKWTWRSPNHEIRNEIDFILANKMETIKDVTVLNRFNTGSDHRLVRAKLAIDLRQERRKLIRKKIEIIDEDRLLTKQEEFQSCLKENLENASPENIGAVIMSTAKEFLIASPCLLIVDYNKLPLSSTRVYCTPSSSRHTNIYTSHR
ncbi:hypothetical protein M8J75_011119 [Diaphorina citri]|nr:hypothetical protein M8J75_011119 [Diaphorina citri]